MTVLHIITGLGTGGAERALMNVLAGGLARRFDSAVLSLKDEGTIGGNIEALGVPVYALGMRAGLPSAHVVRRLFRILRELRPDVIQGWMYHGNLAASISAHLAPGAPKVVWNIRQCLYQLKTEKLLTRQVIRVNRSLSSGAAVIVYNSRLSREQHEAFGFSRERAVVIPNGFDVEELQRSSGTGAAVRQELGLSAKLTVVGHVARLHPMKDHASFLRAAVSIARERPDVQFLLVGRDVFPDNQNLKGIVPPDLLDRFVFAGERVDAQRLMQAMDVFCSSSWSEAFPNVLGEAMATGVPCVATDVGDSADIVGDTGIVVPPSDSQLLADSLTSVIRMSGDARRTLGSLARQRVERYYSLENVVREYETLYKGLMRRLR